MYPKIRVGAVSYLNAKPLTYGIEQGMMADEVELSFAPPAELADRLKSGLIDVGLVPVAEWLNLNEYFIVGDYCIGADGPVNSVALFSECPVSEIEEIWLDFESRTSVALLDILLREYWAVSPRLMNARPGYESMISGKTAGLIIGDRALRQSAHFPYKYDLAEAWKEMTGLPFVFAAWVSRHPMDGDFISRFNEANAFGLSRLPNIIKTIDHPPCDLISYFTRCIQYRLDEAKRHALENFLARVKGFKEVTS